MSAISELLNPDTKVRDKSVVVRVSTSCYRTKRVEFLLRKSDRKYLYAVTEDASCGGTEAVMKRIVNLDKVDDGLYRMISINEHRDQESGYIEDWDYQLIPYEEAKP